jgi:hypothetical protein
MAGSQPVRLYDSYGHAISTIQLASGTYAIATKEAASQATAFETLTITNGAVVTLTAATYLTANKALITVADNSIRVRWDPTATGPSTTVGHLMVAGSTLELAGHDITHFRAIAAGSDAIISVTYSAEA